MKASGQTNWKALLTIALALGAALFFAWRFAGVMSDRPPSSLRQQKRVGARLATGTKPDLAWNQFQYLLKESLQDAAQRDTSVSALQFLELQPDGKNAVAWTLEQLVNHGFNPMQNFERPSAQNPISLLGYYALDGSAIPYTTRRPASAPNSVAVTLNLREPVSPGATQLVIRLERRPSPVQRNKDGMYGLGLSQFPRKTGTVHARAVRLMEGAVLVKFAGGESALVSTSGVATVGWINTRLTPPDQPLFAVFSRNR